VLAFLALMGFLRAVVDVFIIAGAKLIQKLSTEAECLQFPFAFKHGSSRSKKQ
jgi:hypothetical protein